MDENKKSIDGVIEKLALITDGIQTLFPDGKSALIIELKENDYKKIQKNFRDVDRQHKQFKIDISGVECVFVLENTLNKKEEEIKEIGLWKRLLSRISGKPPVKN
jgi:hypothetical protein